jgi:DNA-directed RNA polymerase subunit RPC12/RpoP
MDARVKTFAYKCCPRCSGDLALDRQSETLDYVCLQCGRRQQISVVLALLDPRQATVTATKGGNLAA